MASARALALIRTASACAAVCCASTIAPAVAAAHDEIQAFVAKHCLACHGADVQEGNMRFDQLAPQVRSTADAEKLIRALERIIAGEMPPPDEPRPTTAEQRTVLAALRDQLATARTAGLVPLAPRGARRLNRLEYQNTVNDLLGTDLDLTKYLPEDNTLAGFDKVGKALSISPVLVERYLEAADTALREALHDKPDTPSTTRHYTMWDNGRARRTLVKNGVWAERDDAVLIWHTNDKWFPLEPFAAPVRGKYRFRAKAYATQFGKGAEADTLPVQMMVHGGNFTSGSRRTHLVELFDVEFEQADVFETVDLLEPGDTFKITITGRPPKSFDVTQYAGRALAVEWMEVEGPLANDAASQRRTRLFGSVDPDRGTQAEAERLLIAFLQRAFRRPVSQQVDAEPYLAILRAQFERGRSFREALHVGMQTVLCAPEFLFLDVRPTIDDYDIASRLAYFLWNTAPDAELLQLAAEGRLQRPDVRRAQAERMLADAKSETFVWHFLDGWLDLKKIDFTTPDKDLYPEFDEPLRDAMLRETRLYFRELLTHDLPAANIVDSDFTIVNERLARHYGIAGVSGGAMRKVSLDKGAAGPAAIRGGMLTQGAILKVTADGTVTSPVLRGVWLLDRILGRPVPPPPPGVPGVEPDIRGATTMREQLAKHRQLAACASCHAKIDPPGFALESFDPIGGLRTQYRVLREDDKPIKVGGNWVKYVYGPAIDAGDRMPDGRTFKDAAEFKKLLLDDPRTIAEGLAGKLLTYALGREPDFVDRERLRAVAARTAAKRYGVRSLLTEFAADEVFVSR